MGVSPEMAPDKPTYVTLHFEKGIATAIDGKEMGAVELVETLNKLGGENGIGLLDIVENRLVGMKCRGVYETPGGAILYKAHKVLETICLEKPFIIKRLWRKSLPTWFTARSGSPRLQRLYFPLLKQRRKPLRATLP